MDLDFSYAPKNTNPPRPIQNTLGLTPENNTRIPPSLYNLLKVSTAPWYGTPAASLPSIILVFITSKGVVKPAAKAPVIQPNKAASWELTSLPVKVGTNFFKASYNGN